MRGGWCYSQPLNGDAFARLRTAGRLGGRRIQFMDPPQFFSLDPITWFSSSRSHVCVLANHTGSFYDSQSHGFILANHIKYRQSFQPITWVHSSQSRFFVYGREGEATTTSWMALLVLLILLLLLYCRFQFSR